jgi:Flp pilus assembly protein TadG
VKTSPRVTQTNPRQRCPRRGAVSVEFALVVPILFLFIFGIIEFARLNMLRNSIENAAYEGARRGIIPGATADNAKDEALLVMKAVSVHNAKVDVSPPTIDSTTPQITVTVNVPLNGAAWVIYVSSRKDVMSRSITLKREPI